MNKNQDQNEGKMNSTKMFSFQQILLRSPNGHIEHLCDVKEAWCFGALPPPPHTHMHFSIDLSILWIRVS